MIGSADLAIVHETTYRYSTRVELAYHSATLRPAATPFQSLRAFSLAIEPEPSRHSQAVDAFGNARDFFSLYGPHDGLCVRSESRVQVSPRAMELEPAASPAWEELGDVLRYRAGAAFEPAIEFAFPSPFVPWLSELRDYALASYTPARPGLEAALDLMQRIHADFTYDAESTEISTPLATVFEQRRGVCQDLAHVALGCLRALGLPAAYVSGYLRTRPPPGRPHLIGADASHAWVRVWCPLHGWVDLDPTNDVVVGTSHVTLAVGRDYGDVMPVRGVIRGGGEHTLEVAVSVTALDED
jgi:transglutaminase-like putative cysteine protease